MIDTLEKIEEHFGKMLLGLAERGLDLDQLQAFSDAVRQYMEIGAFVADHRASATEATEAEGGLVLAMRELMREDREARLAEGARDFAEYLSRLGPTD